MCQDFFVVHSWPRCRDGVNVLWCRSHLVWLVFEGSIPTCACFHLENFFVTNVPVACFYCILEIVREKRGRQGEDACMVCKVRKHRTVLFTKNKESFKMHPSVIVNLSTGFRSPSKAS